MIGIFHLSFWNIYFFQINIYLSTYVGRQKLFYFFFFFKYATVINDFSELKIFEKKIMMLEWVCKIWWDHFRFGHFIRVIPLAGKSVWEMMVSRCQFRCQGQDHSGKDLSWFKIVVKLNPNKQKYFKRIGVNTKIQICNNMSNDKYKFKPLIFE